MQIGIRTLLVFIQFINTLWQNRHSSSSPILPGQQNHMIWLSNKFLFHISALMMSGDLTWYTVRLTETCAAKVCTPLCSVPTFRFGGPECMIILGHFLLFFGGCFSNSNLFNMVQIFFWESLNGYALYFVQIKIKPAWVVSAITGFKGGRCLQKWK